MDKRQLTPEQLLEHRREQLEFLQVSADAFDNGKDGEAKRLATTLRVLLHHTKSSHALLEQLGERDRAFVNTAMPLEQNNEFSSGRLVMIAAKGKTSEYYAPLDEGPFSQLTAFQEWWAEPVFVDNKKNILSRKDLVLTAANQDGGAHVDPSLNEIYARFAHDNAMGWVVETSEGAEPIPKAVRAAIRQIAHEVLKTLIPGYTKTVERSADLFVGGMVIRNLSKEEEQALAVKGRAPARDGPVYSAERNAPCPCGSGKKFKKCHGRPGRL